VARRIVARAETTSAEAPINPGLSPRKTTLAAKLIGVERAKNAPVRAMPRLRRERR